MEEASQQSQVVAGDAVAALYAELVRAVKEEIKEAIGRPYQHRFKDLDFTLASIKPIVTEMEKSERPSVSNQETAKLLCLLEKVKSYMCGKPGVQRDFNFYYRLKEPNQELRSFFQNWKYQKARRSLQREVEAVEGSVGVALLLLTKMRMIILKSTPKAPDTEDFSSVFQSLDLTLAPIQQMVREMDRSGVPFAGHKDAELFIDLLTNLKDNILRFQSGQRWNYIKDNLEYYDKRLWSFLPTDVQVQRALQAKELQREKKFWQLIRGARTFAIIAIIIAVIAMLANGKDKSLSIPSKVHPIFGVLFRVFGGKPKYDVFLSFRGADTRENFTRFLYDALEREKLHTFMDDTTIAPGEEIPLRIVEGIKNSLSAVVIFSENFADSSWCLDELLHIYRRKDAFPKYKIFPICYYIIPEDVYEDGRKYHQELEKHRKQNSGKIAKWKEVLTKFENISATTLKGKMRVNVFIEETVEVIKKGIKGLPTHVGR